MPIGLQNDTGLLYINQNSFRNPRYPLELLFRLAYALNLEFEPKVFGLMTDRSNFCKLILIISNMSTGNFCIDLELVGDTLLFTRWEPASTEILTTSATADAHRSSSL